MMSTAASVRRAALLLAIVGGALLVFAAPAAAELCAKCKGMMFIDSIGTCKVCGGMTSSGAFQLCKACSAKLGECEACRAKLAMAAPVQPAPGAPGKAAPEKSTATGTDKAAAGAGPFVVTLKDREATPSAGPVAVGRKIEVRVAGNATTGYMWAVKEIKGDAVKSGGDPKYVPTPVAPGIVGSGGTYTIPLEAVKAGKAEVVMVYARPWEQPQPKPPANTVTLTIEVQAAPETKPAPDAKAAPDGKGAAAAPAARRATPVPINGKTDLRAPNFIVLLENNVDAKTEVARLEKLYGFTHKNIYDMKTFKGFAAPLTAEALDKLRWEPSVRSIDHDGVSGINGGGAGIQ